MRLALRRPWAYITLCAVALVALALAFFMPRWLDHPTIPSHTALYITDQGERITALDPRTGATLWQSRLFGLGTGAALASDSVYTGGSAGYVHAFNAVTGAKRWTVKITSDTESPVGLTVGNGVVYVSTARFTTHTSHLFALRADTGATLWAVAFDDHERTAHLRMEQE